MRLSGSSWRESRFLTRPGSMLLLAGLATVALALAQSEPQGGSQGAAPGAAPEGAGSKLTVPQAAIGTDVKDREVVGAATQFPSSVGRLYCLTKIVGAADPTHVTHLWFHEDKQVHKIELPVNGTTWRTWSYKTIPAGWTGNWRVDVEDANGVEMLASLGRWNGSALSFAIEPPADGKGIAVLVQGPDGRMLGAAALSGSG